ncbi:MAG: Cof-type HAD-IIB family hydrolase [Ruminococcus sp.]|nr:Cof-type HAD-IIB family hydrolase [Ruminococcus sp.]
MFEAINRIFLMSDLDGTLLPSDKVLSQKDCEAIERFRRDGGKFAFATGRTLQSAMQYMKQLSIDQPVILYNGACIYDPVGDKILYTASLPENAYDYTKTILERFPQVGAEILRPDGTYIIKLNSYEEEHAKYCSVPPVYCTLDEVPKGEWLKVLFAFGPEELEELIVYADAQHFEGVSFIRSEAIYYEMLPEGISKGSALDVCRRIWNFNDMTIVAAGDYYNDLEMIRSADFGAAPANAQTCVKDAADYVLTATSDGGAVAELISVLYSKI